jgi:hypothetical protein
VSGVVFSRFRRKETKNTAMIAGINQALHCGLRELVG